MVASTIVPVVIFIPWLSRMQVHRLQYRAAQVVLLQQVAELTHRGLIRYRLAPQINAYKLPHHQRVVQRFFPRRV
jgi:hypothetical protein